MAGGVGQPPEGEEGGGEVCPEEAAAEALPAGAGAGEEERVEEVDEDEVVERVVESPAGAEEEEGGEQDVASGGEVGAAGFTSTSMLVSSLVQFSPNSFYLSMYQYKFKKCQTIYTLCHSLII